MAFTELIFSLQKDERVVSFQQISDRTTLSLDMIEFMVLRAMSLELLKGKIDQVTQPKFPIKNFPLGRAKSQYNIHPAASPGQEAYRHDAKQIRNLGNFAHRITWRDH
jgi:hypothetical protein